MTIHAAKGLEFDCVFVAGMEEGIFPHIMSVTDGEGVEEERRLAFVAYTRTEKQLYLTESEGSASGYGFRFPSRFIFNIDRKYLDYAVELPESLIQGSKVFIEESENKLANVFAGDIFETGNKIVHAILGKGTIVDVDITNHFYTVKFEELNTTRKMSFKAPLKKV